MKKITIGRAPDNDIIFNVQTISNYHADVMYSDGRVIFTDHSTNGSWINGRKLHNNSIEIRQDDVIILPGNVFLDWQSLVKASKNTQFWDPGYAGSEPKNYHNDNPYNTMNYQNYDNPQPESRDYIVKKMSFGDAISNVFTHYADFSGRARRCEYWWFALLNMILICIPYLGIIWGLAALVPGLSVTVRRLHDIGKSGWFLLLGLIPIVGTVMLIIWYCQDGQVGNNEYGASPKYIKDSHSFKPMRWT